jgi:hypothetical protein
MKVIIAFIPVLIVAIVAVAIARGIRASNLDRRERKELTELRNLRDDLSTLAIEYNMLDSQLSQIILDRIRLSRTNTENQ